MVKLKTNAFRQVLTDNPLAEILAHMEEEPNFEFSNGHLVELSKKIQSVLANADCAFDQQKFQDRYEELYKKASPNSNRDEFWKQYNQMLMACLRYFNIPTTDTQNDLSLATAISIVEAMGNDPTNAQCFDGAYERLKKCFLINQALTLNESLELLRTSIVESTAIKDCQTHYEGNEIHFYNRYFTLAASKYAIRPISKDSLFIGDMDPKINRNLLQAFNKEYTLFSIVFQIKTDIQSQMTDSQAFSAESYDYLCTYLSLYSLHPEPDNPSQYEKSKLYLAEKKDAPGTIVYHVIDPWNRLQTGEMQRTALAPIPQSLTKIYGEAVYLDQILSFTNAVASTAHTTKSLHERDFWGEKYNALNWTLIMDHVLDYLFQNNYFEFINDDEKLWLRSMLNPSNDEHTRMNPLFDDTGNIPCFDDIFPDLTDLNLWSQALPFISQWPKTAQTQLCNYLITNQRYKYLQALYEQVPELCDLSSPPSEYFKIQDDSGFTPLMRVFSIKNSSLTAHYLETLAGFNNADRKPILEARSQEGSTPLMFALQSGEVLHVEILWALMTECDISEKEILQPEPTSNNLLHWASENNEETVQFILNKAVSIKMPTIVSDWLLQKNEDRCTPFFYAALSSDAINIAKCLKRFIQQHVTNPNAFIEQMFTSNLLLAACSKNPAIGRYFFDLLLESVQNPAFITKQLTERNGGGNALERLIPDNITVEELINTCTLENIESYLTNKIVYRDWSPLTPLVLTARLKKDRTPFLFYLSLLRQCNKAVWQKILLNSSDQPTGLQSIFKNSHLDLFNDLWQFLEDSQEDSQSAENLKTILTQTDQNGNNLLMFACRNNSSKAVECVLEKMRNLLDQETIEQILMQKTTKQKNALMFCKKNEVSTHLILDFIKTEKLFSTAIISEDVSQLLTQLVPELRKQILKENIKYILENVENNQPDGFEALKYLLMAEKPDTIKDLWVECESKPDIIKNILNHFLKKNAEGIDARSKRPNLHTCLLFMINIPDATLSPADKKKLLETSQNDQSKSQDLLELGYIQWLAFHDLVTKLSTELSEDSPLMQAFKTLEIDYQDYYKITLRNIIHPAAYFATDASIRESKLNTLYSTIEKIRHSDVFETNKSSKIIDTLCLAILCATVVGALMKFGYSYDSKKAYLGFFDRIIQSKPSQELHKLKKAIAGIT